MVYVIVGTNGIDPTPAEMLIGPTHNRGGTHITQRARRVVLGQGSEWKTAKGAARALSQLPNESSEPELHKWNGYYWRIEVRNPRK